MTGCYGNSKEDKYFEGKLDEYLDEFEDEDYSGDFSYDHEIELSEDSLICVQVYGKIKDGEIVELDYEGGDCYYKDIHTELSKEEIDLVVDVRALSEEKTPEIIEEMLNF